MTATRPLALVTGGSSGIGFELAARLAERGHDVAISGQSERVHDAAKELEALGVEAYPLRADAATFDGVEGHEAAGRRPPLDVRAREGRPSGGDGPAAAVAAAGTLSAQTCAATPALLSSNPS